MKDSQVREMFDAIAPSYDFQNSFLSLRIDVGWRRRLARMASSENPQVILDAAAGTAEVALELSRRAPRARVLGVDFSPAMLAKGKTKLQGLRENNRIDLACGDCRQLPVATESVQAATMAFGIRNIQERQLVLKEFHRALTPGGRLFIMEFGLPDVPILGPLYRFYFHHVLPAVGNAISRTNYAYTYLRDSVLAFPDDDAFLAELSSAGFTECGVTLLTFGVARIFSGRKPQSNRAVRSA
ncbi:MAG: ubiquinone/menaquinone biosynthesis methyltransferase [Desulfovibrionaceae bacterium]